MKELKMGDIVEICQAKYNSTEEIWKPYIFIKKGKDKDNDIICVKEDNEKDYTDGLNFNTFMTDYTYKWRIPENPKYRPFTFEDRELFRDKWVRNKESGNESLIIGFDTIIKDYRGSRVWLGANMNYEYEELFKYFTFLDGSPCGVKIEE